MLTLLLNTEKLEITYTCNRKECGRLMYYGSLDYNVDINTDLELHVLIMERYLSNMYKIYVIYITVCANIPEYCL